ncbi:msf1 domain protein [Stagonosporopsis vannaccii]|nr:msf1 domain protein [Stagonosporopsis vannaccii]
MTNALTTGLHALPNELLIQIALHLDIEAPSFAKFAHEPSTDLTKSDCTPLKDLSRVSWRWRKIVVPILFKSVRVSLDPNPQWVPLDARLLESMQGQLSTLSDHEFMIYTKMRSKFKSSSAFAFDQAFDDVLINLCRIQEGDEFLKSSPTILWLPHLTSSFTDFTRTISKYQLNQHIKSVVVQTDIEYALRHVATADAPLARAVAEIWSQIFTALDPHRVVVAAPPATLAGLLDTQLLSSDTWAFDMKTHYIALSVSAPTTPIHDEHQPTPSSSPSNTPLIHRRRWSHLSYNEGSSTPAYSTYEYHLKQSPKILYLTLLRLANEARPHCTLASLSWTAIFPFASNTTALVRALHRIPSLRTVAVQLAPGAENRLLDQPQRLGRAQAGDLWLEWTESYKVLAGFLGAFGVVHGAEFRSGDCVSARLARDVAEVLERARLGGKGWRGRKGGEGETAVWVRERALDDDDDDKKKGEEEQSAPAAMGENGFPDYNPHPSLPGST